jgi:hypothetical protein
MSSEAEKQLSSSALLWPAFQQHSFSDFFGQLG